MDSSKKTYRVHLLRRDGSQRSLTVMARHGRHAIEVAGERIAGEKYSTVIVERRDISCRCGCGGRVSPFDTVAASTPATMASAFVRSTCRERIAATRQAMN